MKSKNVIRRLLDAFVIRFSPLSYHDVIVWTDGDKYRISDNYAYYLECTKTGGWKLWYIWEGQEKLIGGEYDTNNFRIQVGRHFICG